MDWDKPKNTDTYPQASIVTYKFPAREGFPPLTLTWYDGGLMPARPDELPPDAKMGDTYGGALYIGDKGKILTGSHGADGLRIIPEEKMNAYQRPPKTIPRSIGHYREWIEACKGGPAAGSNFDYAAPLTEVVLLGCAAARAGEKLEWDPANMRFTGPLAAGSPAATRRRGTVKASAAGPGSSREMGSHPRQDAGGGGPPPSSASGNGPGGQTTRIRLPRLNCPVAGRAAPHTVSRSTPRVLQ